MTLSEAAGNAPGGPSVAPGARLAIPSVPNLRDLGGWRGAGGRTVRFGELFRSTDLGRLRSEDRDELGGLGLATVYDLRTSAERSALPDPLLEGIRHVVLDVLGDTMGDTAAEFFAMLRRPKEATAALAGGMAEGILRGVYRDLVRLPSARGAYGRLFTELADERHRPALVHCTTGKDRTGWAAATILKVLGVSDVDVMREYMLTNEQLLPSLAPMFEGFARAGGDPDLLRPILGVREEYLATAWEEVAASFGTVEEYVVRGLGVGEDTLAGLVDSLLE